MAINLLPIDLLAHVAPQLRNYGAAWHPREGIRLQSRWIDARD